MNEKTFRMVKSQLEIVEECEVFRTGMYMLTRFINDGLGSQRHEEFSRAIGTINNMLYVKELEAWKNAGLWTLSGTEAQRKQLKEAAYKRFFSRGKNVSHLIEGENNNIPTKWLSCKEEEIRQWLEEIMMEKRNEKESSD
jgi:hypothetical protein